MVARSAMFTVRDLVGGLIVGVALGAPDAGRRAPMVVVTAVSLSAAAMSAGGAIGAMLPRPAPEPS